MESAEKKFLNSRDSYLIRINHLLAWRILDFFQA